MTLGERLVRCYRIHWNGFFYISSVLSLVPFVFMKPALEWRSIFIILWAYMWYFVEAAPLVATAILPIIAIPVIGVMASIRDLRFLHRTSVILATFANADSNDICACFARETNMLFLLCNFIAITMQHCEVVKRKAYIVLGYMSCDPRIILVILMSFSYILTSFLPAAFVCALMMPTIRAILDYLNDIGVCEVINERIELKDDETPYPSKVSIAFYIGVAYAINIGSITTALSSESGLSFRHLKVTEASLSPLDATAHLKLILVSLPVSLLLLIFTIFYLEIIFLGFRRPESLAAQQITINKESSKAALNVIANNLPLFNAHMILVLIVFVCSIIGVVACSVLTPKVDDKTLKYSAIAMIVCFLYFVLPSHFDFCNYFCCSAPEKYETTPSILPWNPVNKLMPWKTFFVHGSGLAFGMVMKTINLHLFLGDGLLQVTNKMAQQVGFIGLTIILTIMSSNNFVADMMLSMGLRAAGENNPEPLLYPIKWACCMTFLLPVSSTANCFALGWGNVRAKDMIFAAIGPTLFGFLLALLMALVL